jgi:7-cyano-7-deazaguanine synthase
MPESSNAVCALLSGGVDSALMLSRLLRSRTHVIPVYVRCGFVWEAAELHWLRRFLSAQRSPHLTTLRVLSLPMQPLYGPHWSLTGRRIPGSRSPDQAVYLPGRNVILLSLAGVVAAREQASAIALGILRGNPFGDATPRFLSTMSRVLSEALRVRMRVLAPVRHLTKPQLLAQAGDVRLDLTFSCIRSRTGHRHCGRCNKCAERRRAFRAARLTDPTRYAR